MKKGAEPLEMAMNEGLRGEYGHIYTYDQTAYIAEIYRNGFGAYI
mgnify:CR=1 FL=1